MSAELFAAIETHDLARLTSLVAAGADLNALQEGWPGWRPLHAAIEELEEGGPIDAVVLLAARGADVDAGDGLGGASPLLMACFREQREAARILLAAGADPNTAGGEGDSPLRWWVGRGDQEMVALLLGTGADRTIDAWGGIDAMSALGTAASRLDLPMIEILLGRGADPLAQDGDLRSAAERLPARTEQNAQAWDAAAASLAAGRR